MATAQIQENPRYEPDEPPDYDSLPLYEGIRTVDEREISFRLLGHYASSLGHRRYRNVDIAAVKAEGSRLELRHIA